MLKKRYLLFVNELGPGLTLFIMIVVFPALGCTVASSITGSNLERLEGSALLLPLFGIFLVWVTGWILSSRGIKKWIVKIDSFYPNYHDSFYRTILRRRGVEASLGEVFFREPKDEFLEITLPENDFSVSSSIIEQVDQVEVSIPVILKLTVSKEGKDSYDALEVYRASMVFSHESPVVESFLTQLQKQIREIPNSHNDVLDFYEKHHDQVRLLNKLMASLKLPKSHFSNIKVKKLSLGDPKISASITAE